MRRHHCLSVLVSSACALWLAACSGQQQDQEELEVSDDYQGENLGQDDAAEGNGQENFVDNYENNWNYQNEQGADVNSDTTSDWAAENATLNQEGNQWNDQGNTGDNQRANFQENTNNMGFGAEAANAGFTNTGVTNASVPMNAAMPANTAPINSMSMPVNAAAAAAPLPPAAPADGAPLPGGRVRYVREGGAQVVNSPGGQPVLTLEQGDHPITWEDNGWLRISNGMYVPVDAMSETGVGRSNGPRPWN